MDVPDVTYARSGSVAIAYQVVGTGPLDLVFIRGTLAELLTAWEQPLWVQQVEGLRRFVARHHVRQARYRVSRIASARYRISRRGWTTSAPCSTTSMWRKPPCGRRRKGAGSRSCSQRRIQSGRPGSRSTTQRPVACGRTTIPGRRPRANGAGSFARHRLDGVSGRISYSGCARSARRSRTMRAFQDWYVRYMRRSASPGAAAAFLRMEMEGDVRDVLGSVTGADVGRRTDRVTPRRRDTSQSSIPGAEIVEIAGLRDVFSWANPAANDILVEETNRFLGRLGPPPAADRVLATVLFTDIVGSTERASELGDSGVEASARTPSRARPPSAGAAFAAKRWIRLGTVSSRRSTARRARSTAHARFGTRCHRSACVSGIGLHTGECELVDGKIAGIAVNVGSRVASHAAPGEVLVSSTVKDLVAGRGSSSRSAESTS